MTYTHTAHEENFMTNQCKSCGGFCGKECQRRRRRNEMNYEELLGAIARGWCTPVNEKKVMDSDLAIAIAAEVLKYLAAPEQSEPYGWDNCRSEKQCRRWCGNSACVSHPAPPLRELSAETIRLAQVALHEMPHPATDWHACAKQVCEAILKGARKAP